MEVNLMNKAELVSAIADKSGLSKTLSLKALDAFTEAVVEAVKSGDKVMLTGFGTFEVTERAAREGRNPATGETLHIEATKAPKFKPGKAFKDAVK